MDLYSIRIEEAERDGMPCFFVRIQTRTHGAWFPAFYNRAEAEEFVKFAEQVFSNKLCISEVWHLWIEMKKAVIH